MAKMTFVEGQTATNPETKQQIVYQKGKWYPVGEAPVDAPKSVGPEARVRFGIGLGPAIQAQKDMFAAEQWNQTPNRLGSNPYSTKRGGLGVMLQPQSSTEKPLMSMFSKGLGGQRFQDYQRGAKAFEAAFMPILSGAAVSASEAQRMIAAALPEPGDSPQTLANKAKQRAMMINGAAELIGEPPPFPRTPSMRFGSKSATAPASPRATPAATQRPSLDDIFGQ